MEQLGFDGMPRRLYSCTPSRLRTWLDCPRRYRMTYLDRPAAAERGAVGAQQPRRRGAQRAGGLVAAAAAARTAAAAADLLTSGWLTDGFADSCAIRLLPCSVGRYGPALRGRARSGGEPAGVERTVGTKTDLIAVSGRIDRLDDRPGAAARELVVVDYKTGRHSLSTDDARSSLALALYATAAGRVLRRPCLRVELHHLPTGEVHAWEHTAESLDRQLRRAEDIAAECAEADQRYRRRSPDRAERRCLPGTARVRLRLV